MSYDLILFPHEEGRSPADIATREEREAAIQDPEGEKRALHLATILAAAFPHFTRTDIPDFPAEAGAEPFRTIEFTAPEGGSGLQVTLSARQAGLTLAYHAHPDNGRAALGEMWRCARILQHESGFFVYDSQLGKVLDLDKDFEAALAVFAYGRRKLMEAIAATLPPSKRPLPLFPPELDRLPYLLRWVALLASALLLMYVIFLATRGTSAEALTLASVAAWLVVKMLVIDPARLRAIGWPPALTFISLFPPAGLFLQLLLFFVSSRLR